MRENIVSIVKSKNSSYPESPFNPPKKFPEFNNFLYSQNLDKTNDIYNNVRETFKYLDLDKANFGTEKWNPLKNLVKPKQNVVIKPNLVFDDHPLGKKGIECTIVNASVIRPIIDYILLATNGNVKITICDVPLQSANWKRLIISSGLLDLVNFYVDKKIKIQLLDLRLDITESTSEALKLNKKHKIRDPLGYAQVDLKEKSSLASLNKYSKKLEITDYPKGTVSKHHRKNKNEYCIPKTILNADLFINIPKLKTHKKGGITFALKNLIGINGDKAWIAHHRRGSLKTGGDEYDKVTFKSFLKSIWIKIKASPFKKLSKLLLNIYKKIFLKGKSFKETALKVSENQKQTAITEGSWYGNDTLWRCIKDLNNVIFFANKKGNMQQTKQRNYLCIGDAIIGGEGEGPMTNLPKKSEMIIGGFNPVYIDRAASHLMGFDYKKIPQIENSFKNRHWELCKYQEKDIIWNSNQENIKNMNLRFKPAIHWKDHIER